MESNMQIYNTVKLYNTGDKNLDGQLATIMGFHSDGFPIIVFKEPLPDYHPAMCISPRCLQILLNH